MGEQEKCPGCQAMPGTKHGLWCDWERCSLCGQQRLGCGCESKKGRWLGVHPEVRNEARYSACCGALVLPSPVGAGFCSGHQWGYNGWLVEKEVIVVYEGREWEETMFILFILQRDMSRESIQWTTSSTRVVSATLIRAIELMTRAG